MRALKLPFFLPFILLLASCSKESINSEVVATADGNHITDIQFLNDSVAIACGGITWESALFMKSTDGGAHWSVDYSIPAKKMNDIFFTSEGDLFMSGIDGFVCKSVDTGTSWDVTNYNVWIEVNAICMSPHSSLLLAAGPGEHVGRILKYDSTAFGFARVDTGVIANDIIFLNDTLALAAVYGGVKKSIDKGVEWKLSSAEGDEFIKLAGWNETHVVAIGRFGRILTSNDAAATWNVLHGGNALFKPMTIVTDAEFVSENNWILCGHNGLLWETFDSGNSFVKYSVPDENYLSVCKKGNKIFCGTDAGKIYCFSSN